VKRFRRGPALPAKHLERYRQIAEVLADEGLGALISTVGLGHLVTRRSSARGGPDTLSTEQHVRRAIERLGVTFIKLGQAMSTRTDIVSPALAAELRKLQDEVTPEPFETMRAVVEAELEHPIEEAFASFEPEPMAAASIGQVYRAEMLDGTPVAVKIQRPGVRAQVELDLDIALAQASWVSKHVFETSDIDVMSIANELADAVRAELDYVNEARNAERLWRAFKDDPTVVFPRVYWDRTTSRVLTLERLEGVRMNRPDVLRESGFDLALLASRGITAYLRQLFELGFFQADPHPGNFLALPENRVGFTDFGRAGAMTEDSRERFADLLWAAVDCDYELAADTFLALASAPDIDEAGLQREVTRLIGKYHGRELGLINPSELLGEVLGLFRDFRLGVSSDFALAIATLGLLQGVGTALDPEFDFVKVARPFFEQVMRQRHRPEQVLDRLVRVWRRSGRLVETLPSTIDRTLRRVSKGEIRVAVVPRDFQGPLDQLAEMVNRLAFAVVVAALIIGASTLLSSSGVPGWLTAIGQAGLVLAFGVTIWFLWSIISAHWRRRRRRD